MDRDTSRDKYFDALRGIAIIFVVAIHSYIPPTDYYGELTWYNTAFREMFGCAVPLFFAISGYFMAKQKIDTIGGYRHFISVHVPKVYFPALLWGLLIVVNSYFDTGEFKIGYLYNVLICNVSIYYFVAVVVQFYIVSPLLTSIRAKGLAICAAISLLVITRVELNTIIENQQMAYFDFRGSILSWLIFLAQGCYLGHHGCEHRATPWLLAVIFTLALSVIDTLCLVGEFGRGFGMKPTSYIYSFCFIMLMFSTYTRKIFNNLVISSLACLGRLSFWIYLIHYIILGKLAYYVVTGIIKASIVANYWFFITIGILTISFASGYILQFILPRKMRLLFGLPKERLSLKNI